MLFESGDVVGPVLSKTQIRFNRLLAIFVVFASVIAVVGGGGSDRALYYATKDYIEDSALEISKFLLQHAEAEFIHVDNVLVGIRNISENAGIDQAAGSIRLILDNVLTSQSLQDIGVYNSDGIRVEGLGGPSKINVEEYFRHHATSAESTAYIGVPTLDRATGQWRVPLSRRLAAIDGSFGGVVVAWLDLATFTSAFKEKAGGGIVSINLFRRDGALLFNQPFISAAIGSVVRLPQDVEAAARGRQFYKFTWKEAATPQTAILFRSFRFPITMVILQSQELAFSVWKDRVAFPVAIRILSGSILLAAGAAMLWTIRRYQRRANEALRTQGDFRFLADWTSDAVLRTDLDGIIFYASPAVEKLTGKRPTDLFGVPLAMLPETRHAAKVQEAVEEVHTTAVQEKLLQFSLRNREGQVRHVSGALRLLRVDEVPSIVAVLRDETEARQTERRLAALASTDGLTGLLNRRAFLERMEREWRRAARDSHALALLFIDCDHFKDYNDEYGHIEGDECLRRVSDVLARHAQRPGDLAARYGGEEFVLLLPNTSGRGALIVAEKLRRAVEALSIGHTRNLPYGRVTVSIGLATERLSPKHDSKPEYLLRSADNALYQAKADGRNRVRAAGGTDLDWGVEPKPLIGDTPKVQ